MRNWQVVFESIESKSKLPYRPYGVKRAKVLGTHASFINARFPDVPLYVAKFIIISNTVLLGRYRLRD